MLVLVGSLLILLFDFGARSAISNNLFEFLRIVAIEGLVLGMLDSEVAVVFSKLAIWRHKKKWRDEMNPTLFAESLHILASRL